MGRRPVEHVVGVGDGVPVGVGRLRKPPVIHAAFVAVLRQRGGACARCRARNADTRDVPKDVPRQQIPLVIRTGNAGEGLL